MRWILFVILAWLLIVVQTSVGGVLGVDFFSIGVIVPDLLAPLAVFAALYVRSVTDAMLAACVLGFALDLTTAGAGAATTVVGPMAITYALAARGLFQVREAFFRQRVGTRMLLTALFCLVAHGLWVTIQSLLAYKFTTWGEYGRMVLQAAGISGYSALLAPLELWAFCKAQSYLLAVPPGRFRRRRG